MKLNRKKLFTVLALFVLLSAVFGGCSKSVIDQPPDEPPYINRDDSSTTAITSSILGIEFLGGDVVVRVCVRSQENIPVQNLNKANFTVQEMYYKTDGSVDTNNIFYNDFTMDVLNSGVQNYNSIALVRSMSSSVTSYDANIIAYLKRFINWKQPSDSIAIIGFHSYDTLLTDFTKSIALLEAGADFPTYNGRSATFRAINRAISELQGQGGNKGIVVLGDGLNNEDPTDRQAVIDAANTAGIPLYFLTFGDTPDTANIETLSLQTNGYYQYLLTSGVVWGIMDEIRGIENNIYELRFSRNTPSGSRGYVKISSQYQAAAGISLSTSIYYFEAP
ncbi:VWA domain-containing protein [candidate division WOR-3 bacterium]|nr:VWA domain-containing protein [candidate division WOR-3 bacterium]